MLIRIRKQLQNQKFKSISLKKLLKQITEKLSIPEECFYVLALLLLVPQ